MEQKQLARLQKLSTRFSNCLGMQKPNAFRRTDFDTWSAHVDYARNIYRDFCREFNFVMESIHYNENHDIYFTAHTLFLQVNDSYQDFENTLTAFGTTLVGHGLAPLSSDDTDASQTQLDDFKS